MALSLYIFPGRVQTRTSMERKIKAKHIERDWAYFHWFETDALSLGVYYEGAHADRDLIACACDQTIYHVSLHYFTELKQRLLIICLKDMVHLENRKALESSSEEKRDRDDSDS